MTFPTKTLNTRLGMIQITPTSNDHVHVSAGHVATQIPMGEKLIVNGVQYNLSAHLQRYDDHPAFQPKRNYFGDDLYHESDSISLRRTDTYAEGSDAAIRKVRTVIVEIVNEYLQTTEGQDMLTVAARCDFENRLYHAQQKVSDAEDALATARSELDQLMSGQAVKS